MKAKPKITEITVTPDNVDQHIDKCKSNRSRTRRHINTWKRAIKKGYFRDGGMIFADENGSYDDAQHRLWALKETGHTAIFYVVTGMDRDFLNMMVDAGKKRTNLDRLKAIPGVKYASLTASSIESIIALMDASAKSVAMLLPDEVLSFYHLHKKELEAYATAYTKFPDIPEKFLVSFQFIFTRINQQKSDQFFAGVTHRQLLKKGEPLWAFFQMLVSETVVNSERPQRARYIHNGLIEAWNAHLKGETMDKMDPNEREITIEGSVAMDDEELEGEPSEPQVDEHEARSNEMESAESETE